jgi:hypothetical protein
MFMCICWYEVKLSLKLKMHGKYNMKCMPVAVSSRLIQKAVTMRPHGSKQ